MSNILANNINPRSGNKITIGNVNTAVAIAGTLTYEDVTSIDSIGIITARSGIHLDDSIVHLGDTNTKIRFPAADTITAETGGSERVRITSGGRIGINASNNTSYDANADDVLIASDGNTGITIRSVGSTPFAMIHFADGVSDNSEKRAGRILYQHDGNNMSFHTDDTERLRITGAGNVLVGTTDDTIYNNGDSDSEGIVLRNGEVIDIARKGDLQLTLNRQTNDGHHIGFFRSGSPKSYISTRNDAFCIDVNSSERLRITGTGRFGFNTTNPPRDYCFMSGQADTNIQITNYTTGVDDSAGSLIQQDGNDLYIWNKENSFMSLGTNATEKVRITSAGDVGIGDNNPDSSYGTNLSIYDSGTAGARIKLADSTSGKGSSDGFDLIDVGGTAYLINRDPGALVFSTNNTERLRIDSSGNVSIVGDNQKLLMGAGDDLEIYHDGNHSYIKNGTGNLYIQHGAENMAQFTSDGNVELYYDNSKKFETTSRGITVNESSAITLEYNTSTYKDLTYTGVRYIYISDSGNDTTGNGTSASPWRTMSKALAEVPRVLVWDAQIIIMGSSFTDGTGSNSLDGIVGKGQLLITSQSGVVTYNKTKQFTVYDCHARIKFQNIAFVCGNGSTGFALERNHYIHFQSGCTYEFQGQSGWSWQAGVYAIHNDRIIVSCNTTCTNSSTSGLGGVWLFDTCRTVSFDGDLTKNGTKFNNHGIACTNGTWIYLSGDITNFERGLSLGANHYGNETRADGVIAGTTISNCTDGVKLYHNSILRNYSSSFSGNSNTNIDSTNGFLV